MIGLVVGGVTIPIAAPGVSRDRLDGVDRARAFDQTYRASQTGNPKREFHFSTPPITRDHADFYEDILGRVSAQVCSGDIIGGGGNQYLWSEDFTNAVWVKTTMTVTGGIADPFGGFNANTLTATGGGAMVQQSLANGSNIVRIETGWIRRRTGSSVIQFINPNNSGFTTVPVTTSWVRIPVVGSSSIGRGGGVWIQTSGDEVDVFGFQLDDGAAVTSYRRTTTVAVSSNLAPSCCTEILGWTPVKTSGGHYVVLDFVLHEA